jgi:RNA polymerase sigma-70 factor (ECF subfamily)
MFEVFYLIVLYIRLLAVYHVIFIFSSCFLMHPAHYVRAIAYLEKHQNTVLDYRNYLKTIAMNIIRDQWRKKQRGERVDAEEVYSLEMGEGDFTDEVNERTVVEEAMKQLTTKQQEVITLRIIKGYSAADTARIMGCKEGTVRVIQYRALQALSEILKEKEQ